MFGQAWPRRCSTILEVLDIASQGLYMKKRFFLVTCPQQLPDIQSDIWKGPYRFKSLPVNTFHPATCKVQLIIARHPVGSHTMRYSINIAVVHS
jgi:hypothetical protein